MFIPTDRAELGRRNHQDRSTLTRNLQSLIEQGWVSEEHSTEGGRSRPLSLTKQGKEMLRTAAPGWAAAQHEATALLGQAGANALMGIAGHLPTR